MRENNSDFQLKIASQNNLLDCGDMDALKNWLYSDNPFKFFIITIVYVVMAIAFGFLLFAYILPFVDATITPYLPEDSFIRRIVEQFGAQGIGLLLVAPFLFSKIFRLGYNNGKPPITK